jgi:hypothetical protein
MPNQRTATGEVLHVEGGLTLAVGNRESLRRPVNFAGNWNKWYRVLRYGKGLGLFDSVRLGLWLARG